MTVDILKELYERDINKLKVEVELYETEAELWKTTGEITNSGGNLCLHLIGNLRHFFGAVLGETGYIRDRDLEFSNTGVSRANLLTGIDAALNDVVATLEKLSDDDLAQTYPVDVFGKPMTIAFFLTHLATHLNYHLGQVNYHRRLMSGT